MTRDLLTRDSSACMYNGRGVTATFRLARERVSFRALPESRVTASRARATRTSNGILPRDPVVTRFNGGSIFRRHIKGFAALRGGELGTRLASDASRAKMRFVPLTDREDSASRERGKRDRATKMRRYSFGVSSNGEKREREERETRSGQEKSRDIVAACYRRRRTIPIYSYAHVCRKIVACIISR